MFVNFEFITTIFEITVTVPITLQDVDSFLERNQALVELVG